MDPNSTLDQATIEACARESDSSECISCGEACGCGALLRSLAETPMPTPAGAPPTVREDCARELEHCAFLMEQEEKPGAKHWRAAARWLRDGTVTEAAPPTVAPASSLIKLLREAAFWVGRAAGAEHAGEVAALSRALDAAADAPTVAPAREAREVAHEVQDKWLNCGGGHYELLVLITKAIERDRASRSPGPRRAMCADCGGEPHGYEYVEGIAVAPSPCPVGASPLSGLEAATVEGLRKELAEARRGRDAWIEAERRATAYAYTRCAEHLARVSVFGPESRSQMREAAAVFRTWAATESRALATPPGKAKP